MTKRVVIRIHFVSININNIIPHIEDFLWRTVFVVRQQADVFCYVYTHIYHSVKWRVITYDEAGGNSERNAIKNPLAERFICISAHI